MKMPRLNRRLTLESPARTDDGSGGFTESWVALGVVWADVVARTGREAQAVGAPVSRVAYRITVRAAPIGDLKRPMPQQRFRDGTRVFRINAVTELTGEARYLVCYADEEIVT